MLHQPDGNNVQLRLDNGPFDYERGWDLVLAIATTVAEKYAPSAAGALPSSHFDAKLLKQ
jgi:hypothetical protein